MSGFTLKLIAVVCMLIDHVGALGISYLLVEDGEKLYIAMRAVGRVAMPLFMYLSAEGCRHTRNKWKYAGGLLLFALISEVPFDLFGSAAVGHVPMQGAGPTFLEFADQNIFVDILLGVLGVFGVQRIWVSRLKYLAFAPVILLPLAAELLNTNYGYVASLTLILIYLAPNRPLRALAMLLYPLLFYGLDYLSYPHPYTLVYLLACCVPALVALFYNGTRGGVGMNKWAFYWFYPAHLAVLAAVQLLVIWPALYRF